jgi:hypothetical protein
VYVLIKEANLEVLNIMVKHHPEVFVVPPAKRADKPIKQEDEPETIQTIFDRECVVRTTGRPGSGEEVPIVIKDENVDDIPLPAPISEKTKKEDGKGNEKTTESVDLEQRYVYGGKWKFAASQTLKLFAQLPDSTEVRISCSLKNSRQPAPKKKSKELRKEKETTEGAADKTVNQTTRRRKGAGVPIRQ